MNQLNENIERKYKDLEISTQIIIESAKKKEIEIEILDKQSHFLKLTKGNKVEYIKEATKTSLDSYITSLIMENKVVTKKILDKNGLNTPKGDYFTNIEDGLKAFRKINNKSVIKPTTSNFGLGISIINPNESENSIEDKIRLALQFSESVIIEEFAKGEEYRFLVLGDKTVAVCNRIPANVEGDGKSSIKELVDKKNNDKNRGINHTTPLEKIQLTNLEANTLQKYNYTFESIPKKDEIVYLRENSNISTGGDSIDKTDEVHDFYKNIAVKAASSVQAKICGVDLIIEEPKKESSYKILELNFNPVIYIHQYPYKGLNRDIGTQILELLGF